MEQQAIQNLQLFFAIQIIRVKLKDYIFVVVRFIQAVVFHYVFFQQRLHQI
jgi:hypothetical protein